MLFVPYPAAGHVLPMVPVVGALVARGVRARVVVEPRHAHLFGAVGAQVCPVPFEARVRVPARWSRRAGRAVGAWGRKWLAGREIASIVRAELAWDKPSLVVLDPVLVGAGRVVRRAGVATALFSTTFVRSAPVPAWWRRDGSPGLGSVAVNRLRGSWFDGQRLVIVNSVPELQPHLSAFAGTARFLGPFERAEPGVDLAGLGLPTVRPVLFVSPGTVFAREPAFFTTVARAFADTSWQVVMATGAVDPARLAPLPGNVVAVSSVPQQAVLAHADVFLTHAGMNSALEAMARGVPMVVSPRAGDQRFIARRLVELGLARALPTFFSADLVRGLVEEVAEDRDMVAAVRRCRADLAGRDSAGVAADLLLAHMAAAEVRTRAGTRDFREQAAVNDDHHGR